MSYILRRKLIINKKDYHIKEFKGQCKLRNPQYTFLKNKGKWTANVPEFFTFFYKENENYHFPRGVVNNIDEKVEYALIVNPMFDKVKKNPEGFKLDRGQKENAQKNAVENFIKKIKKTKSLSGILQGQCGTGKTVMGIEIARRLNQKTLILVDQEALARQWVAAAKMVMGLKDDEIYCSTINKKSVTPKTVIDIFTIQSLFSQNSPMTFKQKDKYGLVMVDECHIVPAISTSVVVSAFRPLYLIGLTATPYRLDKLDSVINLLLGDILEIVKKETRPPVIRLTKIPQIIPTVEDVFNAIKNSDDFNTSLKEMNKILKKHPEHNYLMYTLTKGLRKFFYKGTNKENSVYQYIKQIFMKLSITGREIKKGPQKGKIIPGIIDVLYSTDFRNEAILKNVVKDYRDGRHILILSLRRSHMDLIKSKLEELYIPSVLVTGNVSKKKRAVLYDMVKNGEVRVIIATFSLAKKGLDLPILDSLHLTHPFWIRSNEKGGDLEQAIGRVIREKFNALDPFAIVYDYIDTGGILEVKGKTHIEYYRNKKWKIKWINQKEKK